MNDILIYIMEFSVSLSVIYLTYRLLLHKEAFHKLNRFTMIAIPVIALMVILIKFNIHADLSAYLTKIVNLRSEPVEIADTRQDQISQSYEIQNNEQNFFVMENKSVTHISYLFLFLFPVSIILLIRLFIQNLKILWIIKTSEVHSYGKLRLIEVDHDISPFSYFRYVFLNTGQLGSSESINIMAHEHVHYIQKHSWDNLYIELTGLFQWFNPFYWLWRASLKETHEYLADEGALKHGINSTDYQVLLLNQVAEGQLMAITCSLNKSLTKKRIMMMQKTKKSLQRSIMRLFFILPVVIILALIFSCNAQTRHKEKPVTAISPTKMNVLYYGVDNPLAVAVSDASPEQIVVETDNGKIKGELGNYILNPMRPGTARIRVYKVKKDKKVLLQECEFRVKTVPDPKPFVAGKNGGKITRNELLNAHGVQVLLENFDFDLNFRIVEFVLSTTVPGTYTIREEISKSNTFSDAQIDLVKSLVINQKVYFENIVAVGPDGTKRKIGTVGFEITE